MSKVEYGDWHERACPYYKKITRGTIPGRIAISFEKIESNPRMIGIIDGEGRIHRLPDPECKCPTKRTLET